MSKSGLVKADHLQIEERFNSLRTNIVFKNSKTEEKHQAGAIFLKDV